MSDARAELERTEKYLALDPANVLLLCKAIDAAVQLGNLKRARAHADAALQSHGDDPYVQVRHAHVLAAEGRTGEAVEAFGALLARHPDPAIATALARLMLGQGDAAGAARLLERHLRDDAAPALVTLLVESLHHAGENSRALSVIDAHAQRLQSEAAFLGAASLVCFDEEDFARAAPFSRAALAGPSRPLSALVVAGSLALQQQDLRFAESLFREALGRQSAEPRVLLGLGMARLLSQAPSDALPLLQRAADLAPGSEDALESLGWCHVLLGELPEAERVFRRIEAQSHGALAMVLALEGRTEEAVHHLAQARSAGDPVAEAAAAVIAKGGADTRELHGAFQRSRYLH